MIIETLCYDCGAAPILVQEGIKEPRCWKCFCRHERDEDIKRELWHKEKIQKLFTKEKK